MAGRELWTANITSTIWDAEDSWTWIIDIHCSSLSMSQVEAQNSTRKP